MQPYHPWYEGSVVYQIYPRSFYDANGDGIGDLKGIIEKLDYLAGTPESLGVDAIWICPFYKSPMVDLGYDISDYEEIDPVFGSMDDFDSLLNEAHARNLRVITDFVTNHTSDQHDWFKDSISGIDSPKRNWYVWRKPGVDGGPPNNWLSVFGGSAWQFDAKSGEYYLHTFLRQQPDLNWDNPSLRAAINQSIKFWLEKGVDGFRLDSVNWLSKDPEFRSDPLNPNYNSKTDDPYHQLIHSFSSQGPKLFEYLNEIVELCAQYGDRFIITEAYPDLPGEISEYLKYYEGVNHTMCAPFNFELISSPWDADTFRAFIDLYQEALLPGQPPIYTLGNHDKPRLITRIGREAAPAAAVLLLTLPGSPFIYYGEEIGMENRAVEPGAEQDSITSIAWAGRDHARSPMQWTSEDFAGFSKSSTWLPTSSNFESTNVAKEISQRGSLLNLYRSLIQLRSSSRALRYGSFRSLNFRHEVFGFVREHDRERYTILLNFTNKKVKVETKAIKGAIVLSTTDRPINVTVDTSLEISENEGLIIKAF